MPATPKPRPVKPKDAKATGAVVLEALLRLPPVRESAGHE